MSANNLISSKIPALSSRDTGERALLLMHEVNFIHLPVIQERKLFGIVKITDILHQKDLNLPLETYTFSNKNAYVLSSAHYLEALKIASEYKSTVVPVLDETGFYQGAISTDSVVKVIGDWHMVKETGAMLELRAESRSFSAAELVRLAEAEDIRVLGLFTQDSDEPGKLLITIKLNCGEVAPFVDALERFGYEIITLYTVLPGQDVAKEHFDALMKYLNV